MRSLLIAAVLLIACVGVVLAQEYKPLAESEMKKLFIKFSRKYAKVYGTEEHNNRYQIFKANVEKSRYYNHVGKRENFGITKFSDLTPEEFKRMFLMKTYTPEEAKKILAAPQHAVLSEKEVQTAPTVSIFAMIFYYLLTSFCHHHMITYHP